MGGHDRIPRRVLYPMLSVFCLSVCLVCLSVGVRPTTVCQRSPNNQYLKLLQARSPCSHLPSRLPLLRLLWLGYVKICINTLFFRPGYLAGAFSRCQDELQSVRRRAGKADVALVLKGLEVTKTQLVNFSATCLMEVSSSNRMMMMAPRDVRFRLTSTTSAWRSLATFAPGSIWHAR